VTVLCVGHCLNISHSESVRSGTLGEILGLKLKKNSFDRTRYDLQKRFGRFESYAKMMFKKKKLTGILIHRRVSRGTREIIVRTSAAGRTYVNVLLNLKKKKKQEYGMIFGTKNTDPLKTGFFFFFVILIFFFLNEFFCVFELTFSVFFFFL